MFIRDLICSKYNYCFIYIIYKAKLYIKVNTIIKIHPSLHCIPQYHELYEVNQGTYPLYMQMMKMNVYVLLPNCHHFLYFHSYPKIYFHFQLILHFHLHLIFFSSFHYYLYHHYLYHNLHHYQLLNHL